MSTVPREWLNLQYLDPERFLVGLREIALTLPLDEFNYEVASLRKRDLRKASESRQAALFAYGMGKAVLRAPTAFAVSEAQDYDVVLKYATKGTIAHIPVQLKEWVPDFINQSATLQSELDKLSKYTDSKELVVAFHLNRDATVHLSELKFSQVKIGALWFYGATDAAQKKWRLIGNLMRSDAQHYEFLYPVA